jgi:glycosyltransferase involved in cell wall biosynthesis
MAFFISFAARFYHIPIVHTFHIVTFYNVEQSALRRKSELWLAKKTKPRSVTAPNVYDVEMLQDSGLTQAVLLPNGVDNEQWKTVVGKQSKRNIFVAVGRLEKQKGFTYLIKAASHLAGMRPTQVVIVGEGSQKATLQALIHRLHLEDVVILAGRKTPEEISKLLGKAYAAVFPSLYETTPLTLLEAWASGTPTIATPVGILRDVPVDFEAALIVPLKNERAFAAAMQQCMVDAQLRTKMAMAGYEEVKKYKWPTIARTAEEIYRSAT